MHRTQILLEPSQYRQLKAKATKARVSIGQLVRRLVDRFLKESGKESSLNSFCGVLEDRECQSTNFKKFLYPNGR